MHSIIVTKPRRTDGITARWRILQALLESALLVEEMLGNIPKWAMHSKAWELLLAMANEAGDDDDEDEDENDDEDDGDD
jgi:hypothetical protein